MSGTVYLAALVNPIAFRKTEIVYSFGLLSAIELVTETKRNICTMYWLKTISGYVLVAAILALHVTITNVAS